MTTDPDDLSTAGRPRGRTAVNRVNEDRPKDTHPRTCESNQQQ